MHRGTFIFKVLPVLSLSFFLESCVVLNPIGDAISSGYENMNTYFNVYYNAKRAFDNAEQDIMEAAKKDEGKTPPGEKAATIPASAVKNLDLVIDKCSNILAYHGKSSFVDDALMMTGKAFYYKKEYSKAERKFLELITQYPNSSLNLEAQLWYGMSEEKLDEYDQALKNITALIASAEAAGDRDILARAYALMGSVQMHNGSTASAVESYQNSEKAADNDEQKADALYNIGRLYYDDGQYENSVNAFLRVGDYSDDVYQIFQSELLATQAYRNLQLLDKALALENEMAKDYRFKDYLGPVMLERANILLAGKQYDEAIVILQALDTTYARTATGASADFELGKYYEQNAGDYEKAREFMDQAGHKVIAFNTYFADLKELSAADSVLASLSRIDTTVSRQDTVAISAKDTSKMGQDGQNPVSPPVRQRLSADSLNAIQARAAASLGELFYTDLANPDSAIFWLRYSLLHQYVEHSAPRILYILSELATSHPDKTTVTSKEFQDQIVRDFPNSYFAKQILHEDTSETTEQAVADSAAIAYNVAEGLIDSGKNEEALAALEAIVAQYPSAPVVAKCRFAMGWLYENRLAQMDSAAGEYKILLAQFPSTPYARAVGQRQLDTLSNVPAKADTTTSKQSEEQEKKEKPKIGQAGDVGLKQDPSKPPGTLSRRAKILQSQHRSQSERE
jgi:tetratricopeptide (TPR) repeat protein